MKERKKERKKKRVSEKLKILKRENRKHNFIRNIKYKIYVYRGDKRITKYRNKEIQKNKQNIDEKFKREIHQMHSSSFKQATRQANK